MEIKRRYDMDWLRVLGVYIVIPFHAMMIFILHSWAVIYIKGHHEITPFINASAVVHTFNMPLLFILAGMSVYLSLKTRSTGRFVKDRINKLLVPALFVSIAINPFITYIYLHSRGSKISLSRHFTNFFTHVGDLTGIDGSFTPAQMWFVIYLLVFSLVGLPLFLQCNNPGVQKSLTKLAEFFYQPLALTLIVIPITLASAIDILDDKNPIIYFLMFITGFLIMTDAKYQEALNRDKWIYLILSIICIIFSINSGDYPVMSAMYIIDGIIYVASRLLSVYALIGLANRYINRNSKILQYLSKASFSVYSIHMLVITFVGYFIVSTPLPPVLMFIIIIFVTYLISFFFYEIARRIGITKFIFAIKK